MSFFTWLGISSNNDETSRAIAGAQISIDRSKAKKRAIRNQIEDRRALAAELRKIPKTEIARDWYNRHEEDEINRLEQDIQLNDRFIVQARNNILRHQQRARR